jgi:hypothetical protein
MNERGCSPILAFFSVCFVVFLLACPEAVFAMIGIVFSLVFVGGMVLTMALLFGFSCYCVYQILRKIGRMLGGGR